MTPEEFDRVKQAARDAGYGDGARGVEPSDYPEIVVVGGAVMPGWVAEVLARLNNANLDEFLDEKGSG